MLKSDNASCASKIAVMQPYLFPHLGYFQLIGAVDKFVFYDDVNFIKQGWINRNKILNSNKDYLFTVPLKNASSFTLINETMINHVLYEKWNKRFLQTIKHNYKKAPFYTEVFPLIEKCFNLEVNSISELAIESVQLMAKYLELKTQFKISSKHYADTKGLERTDRLLAICNKAEASHYINAEGGVELYDKEIFKSNNIILEFLKGSSSTYKQFNNEYVKGLSIIDVLMFNSKDEVLKMLKDYELI